jgi:hypothetical protein
MARLAGRKFQQRIDVGEPAWGAAWRIPTERRSSVSTEQQGAGSVNGIPRLIPLVTRVAPNRPYPVFPACQGMQYNMLDIDRYAGLRWTSLYDRFTSGYLPGSDRQRKEDL